MHARPGRRAAFGVHPALTNPARIIWQSVPVGSQVTIAGAVGAAEGRAVTVKIQDNALELLGLREVPTPDDQDTFGRPAGIESDVSVLCVYKGDSVGIAREQVSPIRCRRAAHKVVVAR